MLGQRLVLPLVAPVSSRTEGGTTPLLIKREKKKVVKDNLLSLQYLGM